MEKLNMNKKLPLRFLGALLAALLVLAVFPISVIADPQEKVELELLTDKTSAIMNDKITYTINIKENTGTASMFFTVEYNPEVYELVSEDLKTDIFGEGDLAAFGSQERINLGMVNKDTTGTIIFNWIYSGALNTTLTSESNCEATGAFAEFVLKVIDDDEEEDEYKVTVTPMKENFFAVTESGTGYEEVTVTGLTDGKLSKTVDVKKSYTVTYNANGGNGAPEDQKKVDGVALTLSETVPTRDGYKFLGWATSNTASTKEFDSGDTSFNINDNTTLFAVWQRNNSTLAVGDSVGVAGGTVIVPVTVGGETMSAKNVELTVTVGGLTFNGADSWTKTENKISKTFASTTVFASGSKLVNLKFEIPEGDTVGTEYTVSIKANIDDDFELTITKTGAVKVVDYILGDVNGDNEINSDDVTVLLRHVAKIEEISSSVKLAASDVDKNGKVDSDDVTKLLRYVAKIDPSL